MNINLCLWHMCDFKSRGFSNAANGRFRREAVDGLPPVDDKPGVDCPTFTNSIANGQGRAASDLRRAANEPTGSTMSGYFRCSTDRAVREQAAVTRAINDMIALGGRSEEVRK